VGQVTPGNIAERLSRARLHTFGFAAAQMTLGRFAGIRIEGDHLPGAGFQADLAAVHFSKSTTRALLEGATMIAFSGQMLAHGTG